MANITKTHYTLNKRSRCYNRMLRVYSRVTVPAEWKDSKSIPTRQKFQAMGWFCPKHKITFIDRNVTIDANQYQITIRTS